VILDAYSRNVVGWELAGTLVVRLPIAALEKAIAERKPPPGLVRHSDRGVQYASGDYMRILTKHQVIPSMSRPANPYDNASCESFLKTLKREEIYASSYENLEHLRGNIGIFIEQYYNQQRFTVGIGVSLAEDETTAGVPTQYPVCLNRGVHPKLVCHKCAIRFGPTCAKGCLFNTAIKRVRAGWMFTSD
jgi:transposase InsO family protein